ncbi:amidophosphoribosyltransferase [Butyrivibrio sp. MC2013]|uniref:amidophosphoribosyltransferase n=1 Tax=Butyrivibrio sp. MC2013 TaxID=1280686 RepID=UPI0004007449|nr:amidophosphoribosyltransferase [Butyrivibrio sp. MC2013]
MYQDFDKLHEECGVFGVYAPEGSEVAGDIYYGLIALQHRGQESAGMSVCDAAGPMGNISTHKGMGLVSEVFTPEGLGKLKGNIGVGHVRYSTTGGSSVENAQPIAMNYIKGTLALVHNGNIRNADELKTGQMYRGQAHYTTSDTEVLAYEIISERVKTGSIEEAVKAAAYKLRGGYACLVMSPRKLIAIRDPHGIKPLVMGKKGDSYIFASETAAITTVGGSVIRDVEPGEMVIVTAEKVTSEPVATGQQRAHCIFEYIYFARNDSVIDGIPVHDARVRAGRALARQNPVDADLVIGVPDSGLAAAEGYAAESGIPFALGFHKNSYIGRSFIKPTDEERKNAVHMKLSVLEHVVKGKKLVLIDDSIVRGTTMKQIIGMMRGAGALEVHVRISSPPFLYPCYYGTDVPTAGQLIASEHSTEDVRQRIGADSLAYLTIDDFGSMVGDLPICKACFDNNYPV